MSSQPATLAAALPDQPAALTSRLLTLVYGLIAYAAFFFTITYAIGFVGNWLVPKSIDSGHGGPMLTALLVNSSILLAFVVQHTIMARPAFKRWWTRVIPPAIERSTFVLIASSLLLVLFWQWRPLPQVVWKIDDPLVAGLLQGLSLTGWIIVFASSFMVNHFDLFGLRQTWHHFRARACSPVGFRLVGLYKLVRHPLMLGFLIAFWSAPVMTQGHLLFALLTTGYILVGTRIEERDLVAQHGESYESYRREVPGLLPIPRRR
jgi:protein-S-isoprenylcysteine O-methyltransferase Ste14